MDTLKDDEEREINHHGKPMAVGEESNDDPYLPPVENIVKVSGAELRHRREDRQVAAQKDFYNQIRQAQRNKDRLRRCKRIGKVEIPTIIIIFVLIYWVYGLRNMA